MKQIRIFLYQLYPIYKVQNNKLLKNHANYYIDLENFTMHSHNQKYPELIES